LDCSTPGEEVSPKADELVRPKQSEVSNGPSIPREFADRPKNKNLIISVHIPKTGGTTFVNVLRKCAEEVLYLDYGMGQLAPTALFRRGKRNSTPLIFGLSIERHIV
jgi:hypothetical protein